MTGGDLGSNVKDTCSHLVSVPGPGLAQFPDWDINLRKGDRCVDFMTRRPSSENDR